MSPVSTTENINNQQILQAVMNDSRRFTVAAARRCALWLRDHGYSDVEVIETFPAAPQEPSVRVRYVGQGGTAGMIRSLADFIAVRNGSRQAAATTEQVEVGL